MVIVTSAPICLQVLYTHRRLHSRTWLNFAVVQDGNKSCVCSVSPCLYFDERISTNICKIFHKKKRTHKCGVYVHSRSRGP
jgi:hypothetical protein